MDTWNSWIIPGWIHTTLGIYLAGYIELLVGYIELLDQTQHNEPMNLYGPMNLWTQGWTYGQRVHTMRDLWNKEYIQ